MLLVPVVQWSITQWASWLIVLVLGLIQLFYAWHFHFDGRLFLSLAESDDDGGGLDAFLLLQRRDRCANWWFCTCSVQVCSCANSNSSKARPICATKPLHNQKIIAANRAAFAKQSEQLNQQDQLVIDEVQSVAEINNAPQPVRQAPRIEQITKCQTGSGRVVYQEQDCFSTGLVPVKVLSNAELIGSRADAHKIKLIEQVTQESPQVLMLETTEKRRSPDCQQISSDRDNVRSRRRINSTQWLRDEYERLTKRWMSGLKKGAFALMPFTCYVFYMLVYK